jgi:hypothetical protein
MKTGYFEILVNDWLNVKHSKLGMYSVIQVHNILDDSYTNILHLPNLNYITLSTIEVLHQQQDTDIPSS